MTQRFYRILFLLFVVAGSVRTFAQAASSEVGVWVLQPQLEESQLLDELDEASISFDEDIGYGVSFNHYWLDQFSTEFSIQKMGGDMIVSESGSILEFNVGELDATAINAMAQWHFNTAGRFSPYLAGGLAHLSGEFDPIDDEEEDFGTSELESEIAWSAAVGADIRLTDRLLLTGEVKYTPWSAVAEEDEEAEALDLNPLVLGVGLKVRF